MMDMVGEEIATYKSMSMEKTRREKKRYSEEFRRNAVALTESSEEPLVKIAAQLGVSHWNLRDWRKVYGKAATGRKAGKAVGSGDAASELARLRRENESLKARCDVLKKALGILAEPSGNVTRA